MYKPNRNIRIDGNDYYINEEYKEIPKGWEKEFTEIKEEAKPKRTKKK